jgi:UMF1 family MFS transporter
MEVSVLDKLGLSRPELRAWAMYDWANSAFITTVVSALFPPFFGAVACAGVAPEDATFRLAVATSIALTIIAIASPILGAIADRIPVKKKLIAVFSGIGIVTTALMTFIGTGDWVYAAILFGIGNIAANGAFVFYDALLPHIAKPDELDRVSTAGYALGYFGGGLLLTANAVMILSPSTFGLANATQAVQVAFAMTAVWWGVFSIPLFRRVREPDVQAKPSTRGAVRSAFGDLRVTFRELRKYRQAMLLLVAFLLYNDGIGTIYRMATAYGQELGLETSQMITALILVQFVGIPTTFAFGLIAGRIGTRRSIFIGLVVYCGVSVLGYFMTTVTHFYALAALVGLVQGGTQALSRSLFASMIPRAKSSEFFGLFAVFEKFAGILGPAIFAAVNGIFGSSRPAILSIIGFFVIGGFLLALVNVEEGQRVAREANRETDT